MSNLELDRLGRVAVYIKETGKVIKMAAVDAREAIAGGYALLQIPEAKQEQAGLDYFGFTIPELRECAKKNNVAGYAELTKADLISRLEARELVPDKLEASLEPSHGEVVHDPLVPVSKEEPEEDSDDA